MDFVWVVLGITVVAVVLYFVATVIFGPGEPAEPAGEDLASPLPQERDLTADDLRSALLPVTARGYRMSDVDALIERIAQQLDQAETGAASDPAGDRPARSATNDDMRDESPEREA